MKFRELLNLQTEALSDIKARMDSIKKDGIELSKDKIVDDVVKVITKKYSDNITNGMHIGILLSEFNGAIVEKFMKLHGLKDIK